MRVCTRKQRRGTTLMAGAILGMVGAVVVAFCNESVSGARRAAGQDASAVAAEDTDSPEAIADMPSGVFGPGDLPRLPVLPMREAPPHVKATVQAMGRTYDHLVRPQDRFSGVLEAPDSAQAPPRMDAGDSDPDRVHAPAPTPLPR